MKTQKFRRYASIPHLIGSCVAGDKFVSNQQHKIATELARVNLEKNYHGQLNRRNKLCMSNSIDVILNY